MIRPDADRLVADIDHLATFCDPDQPGATRRVLTPEYQRIVSCTPHMVYVTPMWLKGLALALIGGTAALAVYAVVAS